jgi:hypothetical protein
VKRPTYWRRRYWSAYGCLDLSYARPDRRHIDAPEWKLRLQFIETEYHCRGLT